MKSADMETFPFWKASSLTRQMCALFIISPIHLHRKVTLPIIVLFRIFGTVEKPKETFDREHFFRIKHRK